MTFNSQFITLFSEKLERHVKSKIDKSKIDSFINSENYFICIIDKFIKVFEKMQKDGEISNLCGEVMEKFIEEYMFRCRYESARDRYLSLILGLRHL